MRENLDEKVIKLHEETGCGLMLAKSRYDFTKTYEQNKEDIKKYLKTRTI